MVVVGAGISGITAAVEAAEIGCDVILVERGPVKKTVTVKTVTVTLLFDRYPLFRSIPALALQLPPMAAPTVRLSAFH